MKSSQDIRQAFLNYFAKRGHQQLASGPITPPNDPTLMFANAGMNQFKDVFTGKETRDYKRATTSQKCIRISGKHNDLENVGFTARHHTFFEMLGNFSFGDYFKREAIEFAWGFITEELGLSPEKLVISIFGGEDGLPADEEAARLWKDVAGLPRERIKRCGKKDNFWQMGDTGPCGPCSEIHYFTGDGEPDPASFGEEPTPDGKGWVELWNLVFMQYERFEDGRMEPLPAPSIDTGAGLERLAAVSQGVLSNYDTDLLRPTVNLAAKLAGKTYGASLEDDDVSMRVIADHARTTAFMISEGIFPGNEGRAYVLRRVMRRAIRHGHRLGIERLFLHECALKVVELMSDAYPQLEERRALIEDITQQEETRFRRTLKRGLELLDSNEKWIQLGAMKVLPGEVAADLWKTYGLPFDLQQVIGREKGFQVDQKGFSAAMAREKEISAGSAVGEKAVGEIYHALREALPSTTFVGYDQEQDTSEVLALVSNGERIDTLSAGMRGEVVVARTPFYAESGGQVGDQGELRFGEARFVVSDTQKPVDGLWVHHGTLESGTLSVGNEVALEVDHALRSATRRNHSATHLLHWALQEVLGPQAMQKGSLVGPSRLRFDYASGRPMTPEELQRVEDMVNAKIMLNAPVETEVLGIEEAKSKGAVGIFEEKYGDVVRMLRMTDDSIELCGGTHALHTGDIGFFKVVSESGLAAGVRRIECQTGQGALQYVRTLETELSEAALLLKGAPTQTVEKVKRLIATQRALQKEIEKLQQKLVSGSTQDVTANAKKVGDVTLLGTQVSIGDAKALRSMADQLRDKMSPAVILLGAETEGGKAILACTVSKELTDRYHAGKLIKAAASMVGGGGGGRPDFAQAGGSDPSKLQEAVQVVYENT